MLLPVDKSDAILSTAFKQKKAQYAVVDETDEKFFYIKKTGDSVMSVDNVDNFFPYFYPRCDFFYTHMHKKRDIIE